MQTLQIILDELTKQNKNQKELCDFLGIKKSNFSDWKKGKSKSYKKYLPEISKFLNVPIDYLVNPTDNKHQTFISYKNMRSTPAMDAMSEALKAITKQTEKSLLGANALEQTLLDAFRASTDAGRMTILEAALKAKMANEGSDVAQKKKS